MKTYTRFKLEELVDVLGSNIRNSVIGNSMASVRKARNPFTPEESAQFMIARIALDQDGLRKGACAARAAEVCRALHARKPELRNLSRLFEDAVGRFSVAEVQQELERAGMVFDAKRTLTGHKGPRR